MTQPTPEQIEAAVRVSRHPRLRELCDPAHPAHNPAYYALVVRLADEGEVIAAPSEPSLIHKAMNFAGAVVDHAITGWHKAAPEVVEARLAVCRECDQFINGSCRLCGCAMALKASWAEQKCPIAKW